MTGSTCESTEDADITQEWHHEMVTVSSLMKGCRIGLAPGGVSGEAKTLPSAFVPV